MEKKTIAIILVILAVIGIYFLTWLNWYSIGEGQATLHAYPITLNPDGSWSSGVMEHIDKALIVNATYLTEKDFSQYPAIAEAITGKRTTFRGFSKMGGVDSGDETVLTKNYFISEYEGNYYLLLVTLH